MPAYEPHTKSMNMSGSYRRLWLCTYRSIIPCIYPHSMAGWWRYPDVLHCHDGKADCQDVLYIFSVRISVSHGWRVENSHISKPKVQFESLFNYYLIFIHIFLILSLRVDRKTFHNILLYTIPCTYPHSMAGWWRFPGVFHCHDEKTDCPYVLYIFSVRISVSHGLYLATVMLECPWSTFSYHMASL